MPSTLIEVGVRRYFRGDHIEESLADKGGSKGARYVYLQLTLGL